MGRGTTRSVVEGQFELSRPLHRVPRSMNRSPRPPDAAGECGALPTCSSPRLRRREERVPLETRLTLNYLVEMLKLIRTAAIAASLAIVPGAVLSQDPIGPALALATSPKALSAPAPQPAPRPTPPVDPLLAHEADHSHDSGLAPGQTAADFNAWLARSPAHRAEVAAFDRRLAAEGVAGIVPTWQLIRTASSWRECAAEPFEVAPADKWDHIVDTLKF